VRYITITQTLSFERRRKTYSSLDCRHGKIYSLQRTTESSRQVIYDRKIKIRSIRRRERHLSTDVV